MTADSFIVTISAWTEPGCKNPDRDPHADLGDAFKKGLSGFCSTKKAGAIFFWLTFGIYLIIVLCNRNSITACSVLVLHPHTGRARLA